MTENVLVHAKDVEEGMTLLLDLCKLAGYEETESKPYKVIKVSQPKLFGFSAVFITIYDENGKNKGEWEFATHQYLERLP